MLWLKCRLYLGLGVPGVVVVVLLVYGARRQRPAADGRQPAGEPLGATAVAIIAAAAASAAAAKAAAEAAAAVTAVAEQRAAVARAGGREGACAEQSHEAHNKAMLTAAALGCSSTLNT